MNKSFISAIQIFAAFALCACGQSGEGEQPAEAPATQAAMVQRVEVITAASETVPQEGIYTATVQANIVNNIAPQAGGRIEKINVEIGDFVKEGQILAEMDNANLEQAEFRLDNAKDELDRVRQLLDEGGISQSDYDQLELSYKVAKSGYDNLLENTVLRSPISGVVTARNYDRGDMYSMSQPLFTVQQITPVKMFVAISESDYTKVKKGDSVSITADALPGREFTGHVVRLHPTMDASTHTFNVEVQVRNERCELRPGMYVRAIVNFGNNESVTLPDQAVLKMQGAGVRYVFALMPDGTVNTRVVTLGRHIDGKYEILSGVEPGEEIVVKGQTLLKAGQQVEVVR